MNSYVVVHLTHRVGKGLQHDLNALARQNPGWSLVSCQQEIPGSNRAVMTVWGHTNQPGTSYFNDDLTTEGDNG